MKKVSKGRLRVVEPQGSAAQEPQLTLAMPEVVGVISVNDGFDTPAACSSALALATSRFGTGMFFA